MYNKYEDIFTKNDIPLFKKELKKSIVGLDKDRRDNWHKGLTGRSAEKDVIRLKKIIKLLNAGLSFVEYNEGLVIVNNKFILSLVHNRWRVKGKSIWYWYTNDIQKFKERYIDSDKMSQIENK